MSNLYLNSEVVNYYMEQKGIKKQTILLRKIGIELGYEGGVLEDFVNKSKANFSNSLKGKRSLNIDYVIPLEKIFGVSLAKMLSNNIYSININKEEVPFLKGIKYYAYMDDLDLYNKELSKLTDKDGKSIIYNSDEYGRYFIDYVVEYNSINAIKYLYENYGLKLKWYHNNFETKDNKFIDLAFSNTLPLMKMIADLNNEKMFFDIYDTYNMFFTNGHYGGTSGFFEKEDFIKIILNYKHLFNSIFTKKEYNKKNIINPIINVCLKYALNNLEEYKEQVIKILEFGIEHNQDVISNLNDNHRYIINDLGGIEVDSKEIINLLIYCKEDIDDIEVKELVKELRKFDYNNILKFMIYKNY